jgi:putative SOS response-associated peptidase YedK
LRSWQFIVSPGENGWRCNVLTKVFHEPNWKPGKAEHWIIQQPGSVPMGIAGIYRKWRHPDGREIFTFAMLTVNADGHPIMQRYPSLARKSTWRWSWNLWTMASYC